MEAIWPLNQLFKLYNQIILVYHNASFDMCLNRLITQFRAIFCLHFASEWGYFRKQLLSLWELESENPFSTSASKSSTRWFFEDISSDSCWNFLLRADSDIFTSHQRSRIECLVKRTFSCASKSLNLIKANPLDRRIWPVI